MKKLTGTEAIDYARENDLTLNKYADPTEDGRSGLTPEEAEEVATEDPSLIWIEVEAGPTLYSVERSGDIFLKAKTGRIYLISPESGEYEEITGLPREAVEVAAGTGFDIEIPAELI